MSKENTDPAGMFAYTPRRRGFFLTAWLSLLTFGTVLSAYVAVTETPRILEAYPDSPAAILWIKTALAVLNVLFIFGIWFWDRRALYALGVSTVVVFVINATANQEWLYFTSGLVGYLVLFLLIRFSKTWSHFTSKIEGEPDSGTS